jgi:hypothetical protein
VPDPILKTSGTQATQHFERAAANLALRQTAGGEARGNVSPWPGCTDLDFHGTLAAVWIWDRHHTLSGDGRFSANRDAGWSFVENAWRDFIPEAIGPDASDEAAYDCALVLRAALAEPGFGPRTDPRAKLVGGAARVLAGYLAELDDLSGRDFQDPGFLAWNLIDYARAVEDRGLLSTARRFVERAFGMKAPPAFASEPDVPGRLFDFTSTTATRVLSVMASEGNTPFVGAWLRERVATAIPKSFVPRLCDELCWNACTAALLGRAYAVSTDPRFLDGYRAICGELARRDADFDPGHAQPQSDVGGGPGTEAAEATGTNARTLVTFFQALAADALVRPEGGVAALASRNAHG